MLVSVIVITYNSAHYVLDTLESVHRQSFNDIELIVSDDCSTDNTLDLCRGWLASHSDRFINCQLVQTPHNRGICCNYNYALQHARGEWVKYIAGDDILEDNCIERFVANIKKDIFIYTCKSIYWDEGKGIELIHSTKLPNTSAFIQARKMLKYFYGINGPTIFLERTHLMALGGFDQKYPMIEDWPIAMRYTTQGFRIGIIDEPLIRWRIYNSSISHSNSLFAKSVAMAREYYTSHYCLRYLLPFHAYHHWLDFWLVRNAEKGIKKSVIGYMLRVFDFVNWKRKLFPIRDLYYLQ